MKATGERSAPKAIANPAATPAAESRQQTRGSGTSRRPLRIALHAARIVAGPLVLIGFFLPWAEGSGVLAASEFTGFRLLGFAGRLEQLDLSLFQSGSLWLARIILLGVVIAAAWHTALAPAHRWHRFYALSGWYLVIVLACALGLGAARSGFVLPRLGLALCSAGALLFALSGVVELVGRKFGTYPPSPTLSGPERSTLGIGGRLICAPGISPQQPEQAVGHDGGPDQGGDDDGETPADRG